jgi:ATP-dependent DNA helicase RecQ
LEPDRTLGVTVERLMELPPRLRMRTLNFLVRWRRYEEALPLARRLAGEQPDRLLYRSTLAKVLAALGRCDEASAIVEELDYQYHGRPNTLAAAGDVEMARGDLPSALKRYLQMLQAHPESPKAWRRLAALYLAAGQLEKAHIYCRKVIAYYEGKPRKAEEDAWLHPDVLRVLVQIHRARGDESLAAQIEQELADRERREEEDLRAELKSIADGIASAQKNEPKHRRQEVRAELWGPHAPVQPEHPVRAAPVAVETAPAEHRPPSPPAPGLPTEASRCLTEVFGHSEFRPGQEEAIARALAGQDLLVIMPTGAGKSLCYQLPAALGKRVVVISPLIALMKDQVDGLPGTLAARATLINSTLESDELERRQGQIAAGRYTLIYAAPERLRQRPFLHALLKAGVDLFVVDEVHCVSIWGHDFRPDYLFIAPALELLGSPTFCGMTATAGPDMREDIKSQVGRCLVTVSVGTYRPNLILDVREASSNHQKLRALARICLSEPGCGIIYANSRRNTERIASYLCAAGVQASHYHAGMEPEERTAAQEAFMRGECRVMAATVAFGMGVDKRDVRFVAHFSLPKSLENYYQEAGRAGRDGLTSRCILFYSPGDKGRLTTWAKADQIKLDHLKRVYESIKLLIPEGAGPIHDDDIQRDSDLDETSVRVAVSMLERVGLIRRRLDVPTTATITVKSCPDADDGLREFVQAAHLREGQRISLDLTELSGRTGIPPYEIEPLLLGWRDRHWLAYRSSGRTMYIELCRATRGARAALEEMIAEYGLAALRKVETLAAYAKSTGCRHDFIARHFGEAPVQGCRSCDNCTKAAAPANLTEDHLLVLKGILCLPIRLGRTGLVKALVGAPGCPLRPHEWPQLGAFSGRTRDSVRDLVEDLIDWGYLERDGSPLRPLLALTPAGRKLAVAEDGSG